MWSEHKWTETEVWFSSQVKIFREMTAILIQKLKNWHVAFWRKRIKVLVTESNTGKSLSEALIFASTNPKYDDRLFIALQVQYMKIPYSNLGRTWCVQKLFLTFRTIFVNNMFSPCSAKRRVSDKDLPVP